MTFDFRARWATLHDPGQVAEGGRNRYNNCIPEAAHECMQAITGVHIPPQQWTDYETRDPNFSGYTQLGWAVDFARSHFAPCPPMTITNPNDVWAYANDAGARGEPCAVLFHIDNSVTIGAGRNGFHCSVPVACDGETMIVRNVWRAGWYQSFTRAEFSAATDGSNAGSLIHFHGSVASGDLQSALDLLGELQAMGIFKNDDDAKNWFCVWRWEHYLMRGFENDGVLPALRSTLDNGGATALEQYLMDSAEGTMRDVQKRVLLDSERGKQPIS